MSKNSVKVSEKEHLFNIISLRSLKIRQEVEEEQKSKIFNNVLENAKVDKAYYSFLKNLKKMKS